MPVRNTLIVKRNQKTAPSISDSYPKGGLFVPRTHP
jgi:hypothetical protein